MSSRQTQVTEPTVERMGFRCWAWAVHGSDATHAIHRTGFATSERRAWTTARKAAWEISNGTSLGLKGRMQ